MAARHVVAVVWMCVVLQHRQTRGGVGAVFEDGPGVVGGAAAQRETERGTWRSVELKGGAVRGAWSVRVCGAWIGWSKESEGDVVVWGMLDERRRARLDSQRERLPQDACQRETLERGGRHASRARATMAPGWLLPRRPSLCWGRVAACELSSLRPRGQMRAVCDRQCLGAGRVKRDRRLACSAR